MFTPLSCSPLPRPSPAASPAPLLQPQTPLLLPQPPLSSLHLKSQSDVVLDLVVQVVRPRLLAVQLSPASSALHQTRRRRQRGQL